MNLTYGPVKLLICHFDELQQRALYSEDGADYLGTHFRIGVTCVWNPSATATGNGGQQLTPPGGGAGDIPAISLANLRPTLMTPRQTLIIDVSGNILLASPQIINFSVAPCDAANGPTPISCDVIGGFQGIQTAIVRFTIETTLREWNAFATGNTSANPEQGPSVVLSNRWEQSEDIDKTFRSTLHTDGVAIFRPDVLKILGDRPDAYRSLVVPFVPQGYQRTRLLVRASSDGTRISYSFDDEQAEGGYQIFAGAPIVEVQGSTWFRNQTPVPDIHRPVPLPVSEYGVRVEVRGRQTSTRSQLANACVRAMTSARAPSGRNFNFGIRLATETFLEVDFPGRRARASGTFLHNGILGGGVDLFLGHTLVDVVGTPLFQDFSADNLWFYGGGGANNVIDNVAPVVDCRSDAIVALVTQSLLGANAAPTLPATNGVYSW